MTQVNSAIGCLQRSVLAGVVAVAGMNSAQAQSTAECIEPQTQNLMNACAAKDFAEADAALNAAWKPAKSFADAIGKGAALLVAQRAWLKYRDAACDVHASPFEGGSLQPLIYSTCMGEITAQRTRMLLEFNAY
ncbi:lysozyme inhibitor LprI family protein [Sulfitobacter sp.]|uniref:lysozyme inhibitor LprI family protein n=1 Tax=Sulfitobacter sp. TaxID=1903071 RepID=UPI003001C5DB